MKQKILLLFSLFLLTNAFGQKKYLTEHPVYLDILEQYIYVFSKQDSAIRTNRGDQDVNYIKVFNLTSKGAMQFIFKDTSTNYVVKGQYKQAAKLSKPKGFKRDGERVIISKGGITTSFYHPKRDGTWLYYDGDGNLIKEEVYKNGKLIKR